MYTQYMASIFAATLGQRPEALTVAFDLLRERYPSLILAVLHTEPQRSRIAQSLEKLRQVIEKDYSDVGVNWHEIRRYNGDPLLDIVDQARADDYYHGVLRCLLDYKKRGFTVHLMI